MVYSKTTLFSQSLQETAAFYKALSHPARLSILQYLGSMKSCITGDIADELPLGRTTVNQHLKELKDMGLIIGTTEGVKTCYCLNLNKIKELKEMSSKFMDEINIDADYECV